MKDFPNFEEQSHLGWLFYILYVYLFGELHLLHYIPPPFIYLKFQGKNISQVKKKGYIIRQSWFGIIFNLS